MDKLLKKAKLSPLKAHIDKNEVTVVALHDIVNNNTRKSIEKIRELIPEAKIFDIHKLKAALQDLQKSGEIHDLIEMDSANAKTHPNADQIGLSKERDIYSSAKKSSSGKRVGEIITPDKKSYGKFFTILYPYTNNKLQE